MKNIKHSSTTHDNQKPSPTAHAWTPKSLATIRTTARDFANPVDYQHPYPSMAQFANHLALSYDANRTRHSYYRQVRLIHEHLGCDPATITEAQLRDYFLFVKLKKHWTPKSIRQARAAASMFFVRLLGRTDWTVFSRSAPRITTPCPKSSRASRCMIYWHTSACAAIALRSSSSTVAGCV